MLIGYARVSTQGQSLDRQLGALRAAGCDPIFREKASAKSIEKRPELAKAIDALGTGDVLILAEWDRVTRSMLDGIEIITRVAERGAAVKVLDRPYLDLTTPMGKGILTFMSALAEDERERIVKRASEGRAAAQSRGVKMGRKPKLGERTRQIILERLAEGGPNNTEAMLAQEYNVSRSTISRLKR